MSEHSKLNLYLPLEAVKKDEHCGAYILDALGENVCDLYFMKESKVIDFVNADEYMKLIVDSVNKVKRYEEALEALKLMAIVGRATHKSYLNVIECALKQEKKP